MTVLLDRLARPRVGVVVGGAADVVTAVAVRTVELSVLRSLPAARLDLRCTVDSGSTVLRGVRSPQLMDIEVVEERERAAADHDLLIIVTGADTIVEALEDACRLRGCRLLPLTAPPLTVTQLAARAQEPWFAENRRGVLRALGWLPAGDAPYVVVDDDAGLVDEVRGLLADPDLCAVVIGRVEAPALVVEGLHAHLPVGRSHSFGSAAGPDELVAAIAAARGYVGGDLLIDSIMGGVAEPSPEALRLVARLDEEAQGALAVWMERGQPGQLADVAASRRAGTERAAFQCELLAAQRAAADANAQLAAVTSSRSWRFTAALRAGRRRMGG